MRDVFGEGLAFAMLWLILLCGDLAHKRMCEVHDLIQGQIAIALNVRDKVSLFLAVAMEHVWC
jgi:hypothetical protein